MGVPFIMGSNVQRFRVPFFAFQALQGMQRFRSLGFIACKIRSMAKTGRNVKFRSEYPGKTVKSQISSTKLQINLKSQSSMTKTFVKIAACRAIKSGAPGIMPLGATASRSFIWNFEFGSRAAQALAPRVEIC